MSGEGQLVVTETSGFAALRNIVFVKCFVASFTLTPSTSLSHILLRCLVQHAGMCK